MRRFLLIVGLITAAAWIGAPTAGAAITADRPLSATSYGTTLPIGWTATEVPTSSVTVEFRSGGTLMATWTIANGGTASRSLSVNRLEPTSNAAVLTGPAVPDGTYAITIRYSTPTASSSEVTGVRLDSVTMAPTMTNPVASQTYGSTLPITYMLPEAGSSGTLALLGADGTRTFTLGASGLTAGSRTITLITASPTSAAFSADSGSGPLADGVYEVRLTYSDAVGNTAVAVSRTNVTIDRTTQTPTLVTPTAGAVNSALNVSFSLPETPTGGTVRLALSSSAGSRTFTLSTAVAGTTTFSLSIASPTGGPVTSDTGSGAIADGDYTVTISYQDSLGNASTSAAHSGVVVDTVTGSPTITAPAFGSTHRSVLEIAFTLPETPTAGTVQISLSGTATRIVSLTGGASGTNSIRLDLADPAASAGVASVTGSGPIAEGSYIANVAYQDALGNASATSANLVVIIAAPASPVAEGQTDSAPAAPATTTSTATTTRIAQLKVRWSGRRSITAQFATVTGATAYRLAAVGGTRTKTGTCSLTGKGSKRTARCTLVVGKGVWTLTATALSGGTVLASATRTVR